MNRRSFVFAAAATIYPATAHAEMPWTMSLLHGGFDGMAYHAGLRISLLPHWKTYWRMPGAGGISPAIEAKGENIKSFRFDLPLPQRLTIADDEVIGYTEEVVFPLRLEPVDFDKPIVAMLQAFIGVCEVVCIPAKFEQALELSPANTSAKDAALISTWQSKVPQLVGLGGPVRSATAVVKANGFAVRLELSSPIRDIFAEGKSSHYFHAPQFEGSSAFLNVSGVKELTDLKTSPLRLTFAIDNGGLEQTVLVS